jgi:hypothetical protein
MQKEVIVATPVAMWKFTDVSDESTVSIFRVEEYAEEIRLEIEATGLFETSVNCRTTIVRDPFVIVSERRSDPKHKNYDFVFVFFFFLTFNGSEFVQVILYIGFSSILGTGLRSCSIRMSFYTDFTAFIFFFFFFFFFATANCNKMAPVHRCTEANFDESIWGQREET